MYTVLFEYCSRSSLSDHILKFGQNGLPEHEVRRYTRDIVHGLYYMHCNARYIHGDIKSRNILLSSNTAKLASFGLARKLTAEVLCEEEIWGSGQYTSPELARDGYLSWLADITGKSSFTNAYKHNCNNEEKPEMPNNISREGKDFIKCLIRSPYKRRPTWLLIKHPFVCL
ncbi:mitogen-activated protein kinase kinase kinase 17-like [Benincasa hispida]|uniref:mitogen-activated protein kinase kinase kinase 17-like n=1 Tax=Benincasa hispida TaxID=102211 RepID=UPI00190218D8|nr:mitogen-activated protein kinase kinase kinase 17-like [Benincasa hispida]